MSAAQELPESTPRLYSVEPPRDEPLRTESGALQVVDAFPAQPVAGDVYITPTERVEEPPRTESGALQQVESVPEKPVEGDVYLTPASLLGTPAFDSLPAGKQATSLKRTVQRQKAVNSLVGAYIQGFKEEAAEAKIDAVEAREEAANSKKAEKEAQVNPLSGLKNQAVFMQEYPEAFKANPNLGIVVIDLNGLKLTNDTMPKKHSDGNAYIINQSDAIKSAVREGDTIYHWGGDEFVIVLGNMNPESMHELMERIRGASREAVARLGFPDNLFLGASVGGALRLPGDTAETLFQHADEHMYEEKRIFKEVVLEKYGVELRSSGEHKREYIPRQFGPRGLTGSK